MVCVCVCVCVYIHTHTHTHTHALKYQHTGQSIGITHDVYFKCNLTLYLLLF